MAFLTLRATQDAIFLIAKANWETEHTLVVLVATPSPPLTDFFQSPPHLIRNMNQSFSWPCTSTDVCHLNLGRSFFMIMIKTQHPTPGLLRHDGMFYIGHNAINYFFDGSLFVMIIHAGVPPPSLMHAGWKRLYNHKTLMSEPRQLLIWIFFFLLCKLPSFTGLPQPLHLSWRALSFFEQPFVSFKK